MDIIIRVCMWRELGEFPLPFILFHGCAYVLVSQSNLVNKFSFSNTKNKTEKIIKKTTKKHNNKPKQPNTTDPGGEVTWGREDDGSVVGFNATIILQMRTPHFHCDVYLSPLVRNINHTK